LVEIEWAMFATKELIPDSLEQMAQKNRVKFGSKYQWNQI